MAIDVMDGYRPNRWANHIKNIRPTHGAISHQSLSSIGIPLKQQMDDVELLKSGVAGSKQSLVKEANINAHTTNHAQYQSLEQGEYPTDINAMKRLGSFVDVYV